ncbi:MAG: hypothetical protein F4190_01395 [Acidimicrobiales bacterium]|nr:hypothetical protein [Acidimicrobiales bacterium]MYG87171.1 hypothetical protein [Acidimicrobiales bacterium]MYI28519.1 hypothetical protein [Acidimicrobiales bacterium]
MLSRPDLLDNLGDSTRHAEALTFLLDDISTDDGLSVATGFVNLGGLAHLAAAVDNGRQVRLLIGATPAPALGAQFPNTLFETTLAGLRHDRDLARFPPSRAAAQLANLDTWLDDDHVQIRRYTRRFLHGKAYLFGGAENARAALVTSANLTGAGLFSNLELGLVDYSPNVAGRAVVWFDALWEEAVEFKAELRELLYPDIGLVSPRTVYLRALVELLGGETEQSDGPAPGAIELAAFQRDGFNRALRILEHHHGVIYADGVGTGKTEIGLALVEEYALRRGLHALVVTPAQLVEHWRGRLARARLPAEVVSFHQLASDEQLAVPGTANPQMHLHSDKDAYRLVVVDEGHALRTPGTTWYRAMSRLLGGVQKDLALLSATPINNGLWDLYHLVMTFARHDRAFAAWGIPSLRNLFVRAGANERDAENLDPDVLFELADLVSVRRDRRFIERHYPGATFPDGTPVAFPEPQLSTERYDLDSAFPGLVQTITGNLGQLTMARYRPSAYRRDGSEIGREAVLSALLQSAVLKRFESCWYACLLTVRRMLAAHDVFLEAWDNGHVLSGETLRQATLADLDESGLAGWLDEEMVEFASEPTEDFLESYRDDVAGDREVLEACAEALDALDAAGDPKLELLKRVLREVPSDKVVVFSTFADTVRYLDEHLPSISNGRERVTVIGAETDPDQRTGLLARFCPATVIRPDYEPPDGEVDLLLSNDVLSEGQNLQQAAAVVSYDMPWNPQRVVQRYGRVVRLKSPHDTVSLVSMLPEPGDLELILQLEAAIQRKIVAARPYGMEIEVTDAQVAEEIRSYALRLESDDPTLLDEDDPTAEGQVLSGELLRAELERAAAEGEIERLLNLPWGIGSQFVQGPAIPSVGPSGVFFACRTPDGHKHWRYVADDGQMSSVPATILRRIDPGSAPGVDAPGLDLESAWSDAAQSIIGDHNEGVEAVLEGRSLGPIQRWARGLLADPSVPQPPSANEVFEALAVERSTAVRRDLGEIRRALDDGSIDGATAAIRIAEVVDFHGLLPVDLPSTSSVISEDDIGVVCWMGVLPAPS